jgi:predicted RNA-binding Zn-ribbon protein involved in translation (DUF1610 family)
MRYCFGCKAVLSQNINTVTYPCLECNIAIYCSSQCRDVSFKSFHQYQCKDLLENPLSLVLFHQKEILRQMVVASIEGQQLACGQLQQFIPRVEWDTLVPEYAQVPSVMLGNYIGVTCDDMFAGKLIQNPHARSKPLLYGNAASDFQSESKNAQLDQKQRSSVMYKTAYSATYLGNTTVNVTTPREKVIHINRAMGVIFFHKPNYGRVFILMNSDIDILGMPHYDDKLVSNNWECTKSGKNKEYLKIITLGQHQFVANHSTVPEWIAFEQRNNNASLLE